jgi:hypothetical protein
MIHMKWKYGILQLAEYPTGLSETETWALVSMYIPRAV